MAREVTVKLTEQEARVLWDAASNMADDAEDFYGSDAPYLHEALRKLAKATPARQVKA